MIQTSEQVSQSVSKRMKSQKLTFAAQAEKFLQDGATRKRNPLRPASLRTYRSQIETHLLPLIGKVPLELVGNKVVSEVVTKLSEQKLKARTISLNIVIIKKILKSAVSSEGDQLFPRTWNADVIDAPELEDSKQPTVSAQQVQDAISKALADGRPDCASLYAILAGTGLRIAEALAIKVGVDDNVNTVWLLHESKVIVRQQRSRLGFASTKTKAGQREVDLCAALNSIGGFAPVADMVFPESENSYRKNLDKDGITGGFHVFRRFRVTHLRMNGVPEPLVQYWTGHAAGNITEHYTQVAGEIESRKQHAEKAGVGFKL